VDFIRHLDGFDTSATGTFPLIIAPHARKALDY